MRTIYFLFIFYCLVCVSSTAEAVLQEMDNISSIRQNREVERLRMWTGDTEEVSRITFRRINRLKQRRSAGELLNGLM